MSETKRFDPYTGDPIPDEVVEPTGQAVQEPAAPIEQAVQEQPIPASDMSQPEQAVNESTAYTAPDMNQPEQAVNESTVYTAPQPNPTAYSAPIQNETQYNPYTGQPINNANREEDEAKDRKARTYGTVSLITGIGSIIFSFCSFCCCPFLSIILGIVGIIFGCLAKNSANTRVGTGTAGLITSIIGLILCILMSLFLIISSGDNFMDGFERGFKNGIQGYPFYDNNGNTFDYDSLYDNDNFYAE